MTSPSNFTLTSYPRLLFVNETFADPNPRELLGFTFDNGDNDGVNTMIFDSLQLDNVFELEGPWLLHFALPFGFLGFPDLGNEELMSRSWNISVAVHNSVVRNAPFRKLLFVLFSSITPVQCLNFNMG